MATSGSELVATFRDEAAARQAVSALTSRGIAGDDIRFVEEGRSGAGSREAGLRAEMQDEAAEGFAGPGVGFVTPSQAKGAMSGVLVGGLIGAIVGAIVGWLWSMLADSGISAAGRFAIPTIVFAVAGVTIGLVSGGGTKPRLEAAAGPGGAERPQMSTDRGTLVAVRVADDDRASIASEILEHAGATRVDRVSADGSPLPRQAEHPRPADPPDRWEGSDTAG